MPARFRKKVRRMRGTHTHGWGGKKKHRGGGSRSGKGQSGMMKHNKSWMIKNDPDHFGKFGFTIPRQAKNVVKAITLREIDNMARKLGKKEIDVGALGYQKVLGSGRVTQPITVKADIFVPNAKEKIEGAGGKVVVTSKKEQA